jgi:hypothetical protein
MTISSQTTIGRKGRSLFSLETNDSFLTRVEDTTAPDNGKWISEMILPKDVIFAPWAAERPL